MSGGELGKPLVYTPTWVIAVVCFIIVFISVIVERALHNLGRWFKRKNQDSLYEALEKLKEELMLLGFISLLLTVFQGLIRRLCIPDHLANIMLPCRMEPVHHQNLVLLRAHLDSKSCSRQQYVSRLQILILHSWYLWLFVVVFLLMNIAGWHTYFWLSFLPLVLLVIVGAKLEHIITQLAKEAEDAEETAVRPSDELFWFHKPVLVLYLIHFILFQNSFEIAFFLWIWTTYGFKSCIMEEMNFIIPRLVIGIIVQVLCSYSTLPLYALVSQMGSMFKQTVFDQSTKDLLLSWVSDTKHGSSAGDGSMKRLNTESTKPTYLAQQPAVHRGITTSEIELSCPNSSDRPSSLDN